MQKIKQDKEYNIGNNLRMLRDRAGYSQDQVSAKMQILGCETTRSIYSQMEAGTYSIRIKELAALKHIFTCSFEDLFSGIDL